MEQKAHEYGRPVSIEDASNRYFIHPLSDMVVSFGIKTNLSPNFVSLLGLASGIFAAFFYYHLPQPDYVLAGFIAMIGWHIFDGADGRLARATGNTSAFGRIIDGMCDHLVFGAVYIALALHLIETGYSLNVWWLVFGAGVSHAVQAAGYEERRQKYQRRLSGARREFVQKNLVEINGKKSYLAAFYDAAQSFVAGGNYGLDDKLEAMADNKEQVNLLIMKTVPMVKAWALLNANNRTFLIFIFAYLGQPAFYFAFELIVLNIVMLILIIAEWRLEKSLVSDVELE